MKKGGGRRGRTGSRAPNNDDRQSNNVTLLLDNLADKCNVDETAESSGASNRTESVSVSVATKMTATGKEEILKKEDLVFIKNC